METAQRGTQDLRNDRTVVRTIAPQTVAVSARVIPHTDGKGLLGPPVGPTDKAAGVVYARGEGMLATDNQEKEQRMIQAPSGDRDKAVKILAKTIFRELQMNGYEHRQIVALSTELLGLVTTALHHDSEPPPDSRD
jgi:hypothetical protein